MSSVFSSAGKAVCVLCAPVIVCLCDCCTFIEAETNDEEDGEECGNGGGRSVEEGTLLLLLLVLVLVLVLVEVMVL